MERLLFFFVGLFLITSYSVAEAAPFKLTFTVTIDNEMMDGLEDDVNSGDQYEGWFMFDEDWYGTTDLYSVEGYVNCPVDKVGQDLPQKAAIWSFEDYYEVEYWGLIDDVGIELSIQRKSFKFFGLNQDNSNYFMYTGKIETNYDYIRNYDPIPEPSSIYLTGLGIASLLRFRKKSKKTI